MLPHLSSSADWAVFELAICGDLEDIEKRGKRLQNEAGYTRYVV